MKKIKIIIVVIILTLFAFLFFIEKNKEENKKYYYEIFGINDKSSNKTNYLGSYNYYDYYLDGYDVEDVYVVKKSNTSTDDGGYKKSVIEYAKVAIKDNKNSFKLDDEKYMISNIFDVIQTQKNDISIDLEIAEQNYDFIIRKKINDVITDIEFKKNNKKEFEKVSVFNDESILYSKNININNIKFDDYDIDSLEKVGFSSFDYYLRKNYKLIMSEEYDSLELVKTDIFDFDNDNYLIIETKKKNNKLDYYIYYDKKDIIQERMGFLDD